MRKTAYTIIIMLIVAVTLGTVTSCKINEKNYRAAYERAVARDSDNVTPFDRTIYNRYRGNVRDVDVVVGNDTVATRVFRVSVTKDGGGIREWLKRYSVVVAEFKQLFNAQSLRGRYVDAGYARTFIVQNGEPYYYILAGSSDDLSLMVALADSLRQNPVIPLKDGFPYILQMP